MKKLVGTLLVSAVSTFALALEPDKATQNLMDTAGERSTSAIKSQETEKIIQNALSAFNKSQKVILLLSEGKLEEAKKYLKDVKTILESLKKEYNQKSAKLPISVIIAQIDGVDNVKIAKNLLKKAKNACKDNNIPLARDILEVLRNEIQIQTHYLPLDIYTKAINLAYDFLEKGDVKNTIGALNIALGSIEVEEIVIPKPLAEAVILIEDAKKRYKSNPESAKQLLEEAKRNVKLAQALGYIKTKEEIKPIISQIESLEEKVIKETAGKELFESLEEKLQKAKTKATKTKEK